MGTFGLSCDEDTLRLIKSIPPGYRSETIRRLILSHAHEIEEMADEYWALQLEKKVEEERLKKERALHEERMRREHEAAMERSRQRQRREMAAMEEALKRKSQRMQERAEWEANRWQRVQESAEPLIEVN